MTVRKAVRALGGPRKKSYPNACTITSRSRILVKTKKNQFNARRSIRTCVWGSELATRTKILKKSVANATPLSHLLLAH